MKHKHRAVLSLFLSLAMLVALIPASNVMAEDDEETVIPEYYVLDDCDTQTYFTSVALEDSSKMQGRASLKMGGNKEFSLSNSVQFKLAAPQDIAAWYLEMWLYIDNVSRVSMQSSYLELSQTTDTLAQWKMSKLKLKNGWNKIQVPVQSASVKKNLAGFTTINKFTVKISPTAAVNIRVDDICLAKAVVAASKAELADLIEQAETYTDEMLQSYTEAVRNAFVAARDAAVAKQADEDASQRDVDLAAESLQNALNAFGFDGYTADETGTIAYIDFNTKTYYGLDAFTPDEVVENYNGRRAAHVTDALYLDVKDSYVGADAADLRFTFYYYDDEAAGDAALNMQYNSKTADQAVTADAVKPAGAKMWKFATMRVRDAALAGKMEVNGRGYDVALVLQGGLKDAYISRIEVKRITEEDVSESDPPTFAPQTEQNNIIGAVTAGYQVWFNAHSWHHWAGRGANIPKKDGVNVEIWPYVDDYKANGATLYQTELGDLGNGAKAEVFNSTDKEIIETHFQWITEYGIDCLAVQRFSGAAQPTKIPEEKNHLITIRDMAEKYNKAFYVMYDLSGCGSKDQDALYKEITYDYVLNMEQTNVATSTAYAHADGKPVVCIWGISGDPESNYVIGETAVKLVSFFQSRGYYVIIGTPDNDYSKREGIYRQPFEMTDMISPWTVGRYGSDAQSSKSWLTNHIKIDQEFCETYGNDYQPVVFPGFGWTNLANDGAPNSHPRNQGNFVWGQIQNIINNGINTVYLAMFDEYDEGTAYMKGSSDYFDIPTDQYFMTYATDGIWLSNDYYLRVVSEVSKLLKGQRENSVVLDIPYSRGPVYWRNSFEQRWTTYLKNKGTEKYTILCPIDVGARSISSYEAENADYTMKVYEGDTEYAYVENDENQKQYGTSLEGTGVFRNVDGGLTKSGEWAFQFNGTAESKTKSTVTCLIAPADTMVSAAGLTLKYSLYAVNDLGRYVFVDLLFDDGERLSDKMSGVKQSISTTGKWTDLTLELSPSLAGSRIQYVLVSYDHPAEGEFDAYIDDIILETTGTKKEMLSRSITASEKMLTGAYTEDTLAALKAAVENAKAVQDKATATDSVRLAAVQAVDDAIRALESNGSGESGLPGDVNDDGNVDSSDARIILQYSVGKVELSSDEIARADVDNSDNIDSSDARIVLQIAVGKYTI